MSMNAAVAEGLDPLVDQCRLPLSTATLDMFAHLVRSHLNKIRSRWRKLSPGRITLIVLAVLRHDQRLADMAGAYQVSASTVRRWLLEVIHLLAARAERLDRALKKIVKRGGAVVLIDGTLIPTRHRQPPELLRQTQDARPARPRLHRRERQSDLGLGRPARPHP
ncbi:transposase family protein [Streptomyces aurantiogriseus]|uniref:Transposase n=1 Tax=Streptomyces aurantiogriseus TaxID=66870 RepID=A0A918C3Y1_9ACTN|nr:transposase family protein [Streptomyces aurantiogriseus]GGR05910.1 hypothetical protein GCM10010251_22040 [Streptomyces aurantiogriseus]